MDYLIKPWAHQLTAIERGKSMPHFGLFFEQGTGKTSTCINIIRYRMAKANRFLKTLILCPPIVIDNWVREFQANSKIPPERLIPLIGPQTQRLETFLSAENHLLQEAIYITNYESLLMENLYKAFLASRLEVLVCDESQKLKNYKAQRTKKAYILSKTVPHKYILTGTPILNDPTDLFSQFKILDGGATFGYNFVSFREQFFWDKNAGMPAQKYFPDWRPKPQTFSLLNEMVAQKTMRVEKKDCLDLPPLVRQEIYIDLTKKQQRHYDEMKKEYVTYLKDKECVATLAITKALRLQQIASGFIPLKGEYDEVTGTDTEIESFADTPRMDALRELLEEIAPYHKVIVWGVFRQNFKDIAGACVDLGLKFCELHGGQSAAQNADAVRQFKTDAATRVIISNPSSGGVGVNLQEASYAIWYSRNFSLENDLQGEARNYRGGSEMHEKVTRIDIVAKGTIDEIILQALRKKQNVADAILGIR